MPILKNLPGRTRSNHGNSELILPRLNLDLSPFEEVNLEEERNEGDPPILVGRGAKSHQCRLSRDEEEEENEVNMEKHSTGALKGGRPLRGTLERLCGSSPLKTLGKLSKGLRMSGCSVWGTSPSLRSPTDPHSPPPEKEKRKGIRRSSEEIMTLLRFAGRRKQTQRRESLPCGDLGIDSEDESRRRPSFLRMVNLSKLKRDSLSDHNSQEAEKELEEEEPVVKPREPLSVLEILQLVNQRDLLLADTHIQELEHECELLAFLPHPSTPPSTPPGVTPPGSFDNPSSPNASRDASRRKAKDVELLYEALQKEMWDVVRESLRQPTAGPNLGLVVLVIQQEEQADISQAQREEAETVSPAAEGEATKPEGATASTSNETPKKKKKRFSFKKSFKLSGFSFKKTKKETGDGAEGEEAAASTEEAKAETAEAPEVTAEGEEAKPAEGEAAPAAAEEETKEAASPAEAKPEEPAAPAEEARVAQPTEEPKAEEKPAEPAAAEEAPISEEAAPATEAAASSPEAPVTAEAAVE